MGHVSPWDLLHGLIIVREISQTPTVACSLDAWVLDKEEKLHKINTPWGKSEEWGFGGGKSLRIREVLKILLGNVLTWQPPVLWEKTQVAEGREKADSCFLVCDRQLLK